MLIKEITEGIVAERSVWAKSGNSIVRRVKIGSGSRKGRRVSKAGNVSKRRSPAKSHAARKSRASKGKRTARRTARTKRFNPVSRLVKRLNKRKR